MECPNAMRKSAFVRDVCVVGIIFLLLTSCNQATSHILFIGNSYTFFNGGLDQQLKGLAPTTATALIAVSGYTLEDHWNRGDALKTIRKGGWNYVVLQEQSLGPVVDSAKFFNSVRNFDVEVRASGASSILLMTWERPDSIKFGVTTATLAAAYNAAGQELGIKVAPAGLAFARSLQERPDLVLNSEDGHPTIYGTYLAACVLYGTIFEKSPLGNSYSGKGISKDIRDYLQQIAAQTLGY